MDAAPTTSIFSSHPLSGSLLIVVLALLLPGCGCSDCGNDPAPPNQGPVLGQLAPDFLLTDVNPNSATYLAPTSPRQHLGKISAWYFGHAT